jgi:diacylglycerol kinase (ATP)
VDGLVHVMHRHRHMRYHFVLGALVLLFSAVVPVSRDELLLLAVAITFVIMAELINSALETVVDLVSPEYHPLAKIAKDIGGAVVLVASISAALIVIGVFITAKGLELRARPEPHVLHVVLVGAAAVITAVVLAKLWTGHWNLTRGGWVSAHSALAFFCFVSIFYLSGDPVVWLLALVLAVLVAQTRVEAGIHSIREVLIGAAVAIAFGVAMHLLWPPRGGP